MAIILYGIPISTYVRTARLLLSAAEVQYELKDISIFNGENQTDDYLSKHPFGKIPTLEIEGEILYEVDAMTYFVNEKFAKGKFAPDDLWQRSRMYQIISIVNSYLYSPAVSTIVIENLVKEQTDQTAVENAIPPAKTALEALEDLCHSGPYLLGSELTIADFYLIPIFFYVSKTPQFDSINANTPKLKAWWENARSLDLVKEICG